jgi:hypothetical protein
MLLFLDGQAHYDTDHIAAKWTGVNSDYADWTIDPSGRLGNCLKRVSNSNAGPSGYLGIAPLTTRLGGWSASGSGVVGFAIKITDLTRVAASPSTYKTLISVYEGALPHLHLALNTEGTFTLFRPNTFVSGDDVLAISGEGLFSDAWAFVEMKWLIHETAGLCEVRVNGVTVIDYSGPTHTEQIGAPDTNLWNALRIGGVGSQTPPYLELRICDFYLADLVSNDADDVANFLGDGIIETIVPDGVGASSAWTPSTGDNWDAVNDRPAPDADATYVSTSGLTDKDTYQYEDIPSATLVKGLQVVILARKESEGASSITPIVRQGTTDYAGPEQGVASTDYDHFITQTWDLNPATDAKFTATEVNNGQFGVQKTA